MDENINTTPAPIQKSNTLALNLLALAGLIIIAGVGGFLYLKSNTATKPKETVQKTAQKTATPTPYVPKTAEEKRMAADLQKYGVVCKRFTSLTEALKTPEIACILDLSKTNLSSLPSDITKLTKLNEVNLSNNNFTQFPSQLLAIPTLLSINLTNNKLTTTPDVSKLTNLQSLILTGNPIINKITPTPTQASSSATNPPQSPSILKITY